MKEFQLASHSIRVFLQVRGSVVEEPGLFDRDRLRDVARLINVRSFQRRDMVCK